MKTFKLLISTVAVTAAFVAGQAQAQNLSATLNNISPGLTLAGTWSNEFVYDYPAGVMNFTDNGTGMDFYAFCVDPLQDIGYNETLLYDIQSPVSLANSDTIARLVTAYLTTPVSDQNAAAIQWAIWEVTTETSSMVSLFDGSVKILEPVSEGTASLANQYLANVMNYEPTQITYLTNPHRQDVVTWTVVPEPTTLGLAALSGLFILRRRRA